ncbi:hypothetical protein [Litoribacter populi]|uniref:hypothetical protein n=1 Tax=Litoribacter populi TaxID=2598460 RepID=UPI00117CB19B|nr:hypothetical protein [Litoribacter populi]
MTPKITPILLNKFKITDANMFVEFLAACEQHLFEALIQYDNPYFLDKFFDLVIKEHSANSIKLLDQNQYFIFYYLDSLYYLKYNDNGTVKLNRFEDRYDYEERDVLQVLEIIPENMDLTTLDDETLKGSYKTYRDLVVERVL